MGVWQLWNNTATTSDANAAPFPLDIIDQNGFRPNVGIVICDADGRVFWAKRVGHDAWQFPQGGIHRGESPRDALYREAVDQVARLQQRAAQGPQNAACFRIAFDIEKLTWELHYFQKHFLEGHRAADLSVEDRAVLGEAFHQLCQEIASWPRVLCHRDYHSRNLMRHDERHYWIDFQDARMGPASYDLASLLRDAYVDVPEELQEELKERLRQQAAPDEPREVFRRRFDLMCVQRNLKTLGTFGFMATVRQNPVYLQYIPRTLEHTRHNLARYPELERLWRTLVRHVPELG